MPEQDQNSHLPPTDLHAASSSSSSSSGSDASSSYAVTDDDDKALWLACLHSDFERECGSDKDPKKYYEKWLDKVLLLFFNKNNHGDKNINVIRPLRELDYFNFSYKFHDEEINISLKKYFLKAAFNQTRFSLSKEQNKILTACIYFSLHNSDYGSSVAKKIIPDDLYTIINLFSRYLHQDAKDDLYHQLCQVNPRIKNISVAVWSMLFKLPLPEGALAQALASPTDSQWQYNLWHWALASYHKQALAQLQQEERALPLLTDINAFGENPLCFAIYFKHEHTLIAWMLTHEHVRAGINEQGNQIGPPLVEAAKRGYKTLAALLLKSGANINIFQKNHTDWCEVTPLQAAAASGDLPMVEFLLDNGADVHGLVDTTSKEEPWASVLGEDGGKKRACPLHLAVLNGHCEVVKLLLSRGAAIDFGDSECRSPLVFAILTHRPDMVAILIEHCADVNLPSGSAWEEFEISDLEGKSTLATRPLELAVYLGYLDIAEQLIKAGACVNMPNGVSGPLQVAILCGRVEAVDFLIRHGANINLVDEQGLTPLKGLCALGGEPSIAPLLLTAGANPHAPDEDGETSVHFLARTLEESEASILELDQGEASVNNRLLEAGEGLRLGSEERTALTRALEANKRLIYDLINRFGSCELDIFFSSEEIRDLDADLPSDMRQALTHQLKACEALIHSITLEAGLNQDLPMHADETQIDYRLHTRFFYVSEYVGYLNLLKSHKVKIIKQDNQKELFKELLSWTPKLFQPSDQGVVYDDSSAVYNDSSAPAKHFIPSS